MAQFACRRKARRSVCRVRRTRVVLLMARVAQRAVQRIVVVDVTIGALPRRNGVRSRQRKPRRRVIEFAIRPQNRVVALLARRRESRMRHRRGGVVVIRLVATEARRAGEGVVIVDVAVGALPRRNRVRPRQRKPRTAVIERCIQPRTRAVALIAAMREIRRHVIRVCRALIILQMARYAGGAAQGVVVIHVAVGTLPRWHRVQTS